MQFFEILTSHSQNVAPCDAGWCHVGNNRRRSVFIFKAGVAVALDVPNATLSETRPSASPSGASHAISFTESTVAYTTLLPNRHLDGRGPSLNTTRVPPRRGPLAGLMETMWQPLAPRLSASYS